ncbi:MAG: pyridine nucleotide-disulfide oxidoreductase/dicluster-binding protein [Syntrophobacteraceae bacterium]
MEKDELTRLEDRCIQEQPPNCAAACPVHVDVRAMMAQAAVGNFTEAAKILKKTVPFPGIISRVCDQPCRSVCKRKEAGEPLSVVAIEKSCLDYASELPEKIAVLPGKEKRVGVVGGGLSGLTAAFDLARKGFKVVVFEKAAVLGGSLWHFPEEKLPMEVLAKDLNVLERIGVEVRLNTTVGIDISFEDLCRDFDAVYIAPGTQALDVFGLATGVDGRIAVDPVTLASSREGVFAGGSLRRAQGEGSPINSISDGRIAGITIDRFLQKVSLTASRAGEGSIPTRLYTSTEGVAPLPATPVSDPRQGYLREEAAREAARCLQCECLECVKVCEYLNTFRAYPKKYVRQIYNNLSIVMGHRHANKLINSCSLCGLCREVCPEDLHMGLVCKTARETMVNQGRMPPSAHDFPLRDMLFSNGDKCAFARHQPGTVQSRFLFFPGCQLIASAPEHVKSVYTLLTKELSGGVGFMSRCCGAPADWSGRAELFQSTRGDFLALWRELGSSRLILACSTCYEIFKAHLPDVPITSLWETLDSLGLPKSVKAQKHDVIAVHDACTTRHESAIQESVRNILRRIGFEIEELPLSRDKTECCGYGGLMFFANPELAKSVIRRRVEESSLDYLAYCAMCRDYLAFSGKRTLHLLDLIFETPRDEAALRKGPVYSQRHENRVRLKNAMLREWWGETMAEAQGYQTLRLKISDEVQQRMEERLILVEDLQQVIDYSERTGSRLLNRNTGHFLAYYKPASVTYWVEYSIAGDEFIVYNAYSHRMEIAEDMKS